MTPGELLIRVSLILAGAWMLAAALRRRPAALRHWVLVSGILCAAFAPAMTALAPAWHLPTRPLAADRSAAEVAAAPRPVTSGPPTVEEISIASPPRRRTIDVGAAAVWIWLGGAGVGLLGLAAGLARLAWIRAHAAPLRDPLWSELHDEVARAYGLSRRAEILQTNLPLLVTWGARSPKILVPPGAADWPRDRIRVVLAHELAHIARGDWAMQLAAEIVRAAYWCNPLAWVVCRRARIESEHACDDAVLNLGIPGSDYASHLLDLARSMRGAAWVPAQAIVRPSSLERRVAAMLNVRVNHAPSSRAGRFATTAAIVLLTMLAAGFSAAQNTTILTGTLVDQLGGVLPNVPVLLTDLATNAKHEVRSDRTGHYEFVGLPSGDYLLTIRALGFAPVEQRISLTGATLRRDMTMRLGAVQETIFVVDAPPSPMPDAKRAIVPRKPRPPAEPCTGDCVGGNLGPPLKVKDVKPLFPDSLKGIGGVVALKGIIDSTGHVSNLQVVGDANPDLAQAAINAVSQWEFEPTRLDGQVVETEMNVSVTFKPTR